MCHIARWGCRSAAGFNVCVRIDRWGLGVLQASMFVL